MHLDWIHDTKSLHCVEFMSPALLCGTAPNHCIHYYRAVQYRENSSNPSPHPSTNDIGSHHRSDTRGNAGTGLQGNQLWDIHFVKETFIFCSLWDCHIQYMFTMNTQPLPQYWVGIYQILMTVGVVNYIELMLRWLPSLYTPPLMGAFPMIPPLIWCILPNPASGVFQRKYFPWLEFMCKFLSLYIRRDHCRSGGEEIAWLHMVHRHNY